MDASSHRTSIKAKMVAGIVAILLVVIFAYAVLLWRGQVRHLVDLTRSEAELIAAVTERAVARAMTAGKSREVQAILEQIGEVPNLAGIRIIDPAGAILSSNRADEIGRRVSDGVSAGDGSESGSGYRPGAIGISRPIQNRPACFGCHPKSLATIGFLNVRLALPSGESLAVEQRTQVTVSAIVALVAAGGLIAVYFALVIGRRVDLLARTMGRVEAGDLTARVPPSGEDELGRLAGSFNAMVARLAEAQRQLEHRHAQEMRRAQHLAALGKMAAGIAHEINNPLAGMQNCARTLRRGVRDEAQRVQYLEMIQEGLGRIGGTVRQLLDFARQTEPRPAPTGIGPLVNRCVGLLEHALASRGISCTVTLDSGLPPVLADSRQLEQVCVNILLNAIEAMPHGGALGVTSGLRNRPRGRFVEIRVSDRGVGIPPENLDRIFDPFFTTKGEGEGTGLGLSVSYGIVQAHGGLIDVQSELGKGTTFTVALPVAGTGDA